MAGAYDIGQHYEYEKNRGVAFLSTMSRAAGGASAFACQSPAVILQQSAQELARSNGRASRSSAEDSENGPIEPQVSLQAVV